jgi:hypothetical protein
MKEDSAVKHDEKLDTNFSLCFMDFVNEAARVIEERKEIFSPTM